MLSRFKLSLIVGALLAGSLNVAVAGPFVVSTYGTANSSDINDIITDAFTKKYPSSKYEIFLFSSAFLTNTGIPSCSAITGVVRKGSNDFPLSRYSSIEFGDKAGEAMTVGEEIGWSAKCSRSAVMNMMSDKLEEIYKPYPSK